MLCTVYFWPHLFWSSAQSRELDINQDLRLLTHLLKGSYVTLLYTVNFLVIQFCTINTVLQNNFYTSLRVPTMNCPCCEMSPLDKENPHIMCSKILAIGTG